MNYKYLINYLGQRRSKNLKEDIANSPYTKLEQYEDYTDEILEELQQAYKSGLVEGYAERAVHNQIPTIDWVMKSPGGGFLKFNRGNNLPSIMFEDGQKLYHVDGKYHRTNGPAIIQHEAIEWYRNGEHLARLQNSKNSRGTRGPLIATIKSGRGIASAPLQQYAEFIQKEFPEAHGVLISNYI